MAVEKLADHPSTESLPLLLPLLEDAHGEVRKAAARGLGRSRDSRALPYLLQVLEDPATEVRISAIIALREIGDIDASENLIRALKDKDPGVRAQAAKTLERFGWTPRNEEERALRDTALGHFVHAAQAGLPILDVLKKTLSEGTPTNKRSAVEALGNMGGEEVIPALLTALQDADCTVRVAALEVLKDIPDTRALQPVIISLKHSDPAVRAAAAAAVGAHGSAGVPALLKSLKDGHWSVRRAVVEALGRSRDGELVPALLPLLKDSDHDVRESVCEALSRIRQRAAITELVVALTDSQTSVRQSAASALRDIDLEWESFPEARAALPALQQALNDREYWVRQAARETIERIESAKQSDRQLSVIDEKLNAALNVLLGLLKHPQRDLRQAAVQALGRYENMQLAPFISEALNDEDRWVRQAAEEALQKAQAAPAVDVWGAAA